MEENKSKTTKVSENLKTMFNGMGDFISGASSVGEVIHIGDTVIVPLMDLSFAMGAGSSSGEGKGKGSGGIGAKITPSAVLVINNGIPKLVSVKNQDAISKAIDMAPDIINKFFSKSNNDEEVEEVINSFRE